MTLYTVARGKWVVTCAGGCRVKYATRKQARAGQQSGAGVWCKERHKITHEPDHAEQDAMRQIVSALRGDENDERT